MKSKEFIYATGKIITGLAGITVLSLLTTETEQQRKALNERRISSEERIITLEAWKNHKKLHPVVEKAVVEKELTGDEAIKKLNDSLQNVAVEFSHTH